MTLYYNGVDITDAVTISEAVHSDASTGRCDSLELTFYDPVNWYAWQPQPDDTIQLEHNGYDTGILYVSAFEPERDVFRIKALSIPQKAHIKRWQAFRNMKLSDIAYACSNECGVNYGIYGLDESIVYPFLLRRNEGAAAFLSRLCCYEGAVLKSVCGKFALIGVEYAQSLEPVRGWTINTQSPGVTYIRRSDNAVKTLIVRSKDGDARLTDGSVTNGITRVSNAPASCAADAGRWSRGLLLNNNRKTECVTVDMEFDPGVSAMQGIGIDGNTDMNGNWLIDSVVHDFIRLKSSVTMYRSTSVS